MKKLSLKIMMGMVSLVAGMPLVVVGQAEPLLLGRYEAYERAQRPLPTTYDILNADQRMLREEARQLAKGEYDKIRLYLEKLIRQADTPEERRQLENLVRTFYQGRYDQVVAELKALGHNVQNILRSTGLRDRAMRGELMSQPFWVKDILAFNAQVARMSDEAKLMALTRLTEQLKRGYQELVRIEGRAMVDQLKAILIDNLQRLRLVAVREFSRKQLLRMLNEI